MHPINNDPFLRYAGPQTWSLPNVHKTTHGHRAIPPQVAQRHETPSTLPGDHCLVQKVPLTWGPLSVWLRIWITHFAKGRIRHRQMSVKSLQLKSTRYKYCAMCFDLVRALTCYTIDGQVVKNSHPLHCNCKESQTLRWVDKLKVLQHIGVRFAAFPRN